MAFTVLQSLSRPYRAVASIVASAMSVPKRDATNGVLTAELDLVGLVDSTGTALGTTTNPVVTSSSAGPASSAAYVGSSSGNVANAAAVATLPAVAGKTNYVTGLQITGSGSTPGADVTATLAGVVGGPYSFEFTAPAGVLVAGYPLIMTFNPPIPSSAVNSAVTLTLPALGTGNTNASVSIQGYAQ
jgi:hypothetical protein